MIVTLAAILLILAIAFFQVTQGLFSAMITALASIVAAMIAFNYYEPIASALLYTRQPATADAGALLGLFIVSLFVLLELFNMLLKDNVEIGVWANRIGGGALGLVAGAIMIGVLVVAIQMLPVAGMLGYKPFNDFDGKGKLTREGNTNRLGVDEAVVGLMNILSNGSFSGETSLEKIHDDLLLESFAAVNNAGKSGRIDALPDALQVKAANIVKSADMAPWYDQVPNPDKDAKTQVLVVRVHVADQAKDEEGYLVLPATQFRLVTRSKQDDREIDKSYYPLGYLTRSSADSKGWKLWTAPTPADDKNSEDKSLSGKVPDLTKLLVARPATGGGLYVDWVYRTGEGELPAYMAFRRVAQAAVPKMGDNYALFAKDPADALQEGGKNAPPPPPKPEPKSLKLGLKPGSSVSPGSLRVCDKTGKATFVELATKPSVEQVTHLFDLKAGKDMDLAKVIPDAFKCIISPDGTGAIVLSNTAMYAINLDSMKTIRLADPSAAACWIGTSVIAATTDADKVGHIKVYNPTDGRMIQAWTVSGIPLAGEPGGNVLFAIMNPKTPAPETSQTALATDGALVFTDTAGYITKEIASMATVASYPVCSHSLKWIAFSSSPKGLAAKRGDKLSLTVIGVDAKNTMTIDEYAMPVGVTDAGTVITTSMPATDGAVTIKTYTNGKSSNLVTRAYTATLAENKVYYVMGTGDKAALMAIELPK